MIPRFSLYYNEEIKKSNLRLYSPGALNGAAPNGSSSVDITRLSLLLTLDIPGTEVEESVNEG